MQYSFSVRGFSLLHTKEWSASQSAPMTLVIAFGAGKAGASGKDQVKLVPVKAEQHYKLQRRTERLFMINKGFSPIKRCLVSKMFKHMH